MAKWEPPELTIQEVRRKLGGPGVSDEEILLRWMLNEDEIAVMHAAGRPKEYLSAKEPVVTLLEQLANRNDCAQIHVQRGDLSITLQKAASA